MKRFYMTTLALVMVSTSTAFGATNDIYSFLTINGKPLKQYIQNNNQNNSNSDNSNNNNSNNNSNDNNNNNQNNNLNKPVIPETTPEEKPDDNTNDEITNNTYISQTEQEVVNLVNQERQKAGLKPLQIDIKTSNVARLKAEDMKKKGYFSHTSPTYGSPFDMLKQFGVTYKTAGENIAKGQRTPQQVVDAWMNSEGHKRNILSQSFTHIGVGNSSNYWVQMFISK